jgi:hypothetical protein
MTLKELNTSQIGSSTYGETTAKLHNWLLSAQPDAIRKLLGQLQVLHDAKTREIMEIKDALPRPNSSIPMKFIRTVAAERDLAAMIADLHTASPAEETASRPTRNPYA